MDTIDHETPGLRPDGTLALGERLPDEPVLDGAVAARITRAFSRGSGAGLLHLGAVEVDTPLPSSFAFFRDYARRFMVRLCSVSDLEEQRARVELPCPVDELPSLVAAAPPLRGGEYLGEAALEALWATLLATFRDEIATWKGTADKTDRVATVEEYLRGKNPVWNRVGRVHLHLAEHKDDEAHPFAFLSTYTTKVSSAAKVQHVSLGKALTAFAGDKAALLHLLRPVERAAEKSALLKSLVDSGEIFQPQAFTAEQALQFFKDVPAFEAAGVVVRVPDWWKKKSARLEVDVSIGGNQPSRVGMDALLDFSVGLTLDGERISAAEWKAILDGEDGLTLIRGRWVELDRTKLQQVLAHWKKVEKQVGEDGISFRDAMRMLAGAPLGGTALPDEERAWSRVQAGPWLTEILDGLRRPESLTGDPAKGLRATLRPYQLVGVRWLRFLSQIGLGACLADDMGLGKTIQILGLLLARQGDQKGEAATKRSPALLVVPASLVGNWTSEIERFAPSLVPLVAHPSVTDKARLAKLTAGDLRGVDLVITTYGAVHRLEFLQKLDWSLVILDEAQAIKNPDAKQTRAVKELRAEFRIALTGTPIENRLSDLYSLFDFLNPGLLGTRKAFSDYAKRLSTDGGAHYGPLRELVRPYLLRRLKTDKRIIDDLPAKTEVKAFCPLARKQAALYQRSVDELRMTLQTVKGIERLGIVLSFLMRFKQICNHPSQWLADGIYAPTESGKFGRLSEIASEIASRQEKALVFTQFRQLTEPLAQHLARDFGRPGLVLHGDTPIKARKALVDRFQNDPTIPFFILSLKAGGTGLNLTAASHVIHFDRWWNPAVENQATDRAFRIGQKKNVVVHKFICRGTIEEKIDQLIDSKRDLADQVIEGGAESRITEMSNDEILKLVSLDLQSALAGD